jgi:PAS domain S-box-containing protein
VLFALCIVLTLSFIAFVVARNALEKRTLAQLSAVVAAKEDMLEQSLQRNREQSVILASREEIIAAARHESLMAPQRLLDEMRQEHMPILGVTVFDAQGAVLSWAGTPVNDPVLTDTTTVLRPNIGITGWEAYDVFSPIRSHGVRIGILGMRYDAVPILESILTVSSLGKSGEILLGMEDKEEELVLLHHRYQMQEHRPLWLGNIDEQQAYGLPLAQAVKGQEGLRKAEDYTGTDVYAAYRTLPSLGWGLVAKVAVSEALQDTVRLAWILGAVGIVLALGAGLIAYLLAGRFTSPIRRLSTIMARLGPDHWSFRRTVHTGDEVEILDCVAYDMAQRLKVMYGNLEEEVTARTKELREQYAKDRAILESIQHGVIMVDRAGSIVEMNTSASAMLGLPMSEVVGNNIEKVMPFSCRHELRTGKGHPIERALRTGKPFRADTNAHMNIVRQDATLLPVSIIVTPLLEGRRLLGAVIVFQDMTEERRADYIKSEFISLASHQLRTPLSTIRWYLEILSDEKNKTLTTIQRESLKEMQFASQRMSNLIDTLLSASRLEGGAINPKAKRVNIAALLRDITEELQSLSKDAKISCDIRIPQKACMVSIDPVLLHVIMQNLFSNAVKYSRQGDTVTIGFKQTARQIKITVADTGIGIPQGEQKRVFERLFRARNAVAIDTDGSGLGLYIAKMILEIMGGSITFKSKENEGTTFTITLPRTYVRQSSAK